MSYINFTTTANGILFDLSAISGAGTQSTKYLFRPSIFHTITRVSVQDSRMSYTTAEGTDFNFSYDGTEFSQLKIAGVAASDNYDLFNKFIALL